MTTVTPTDLGVQFAPEGRDPVFVPWIAPLAPRWPVRLLDARKTWGHAFTEEDVRFRVEKGIWPPDGYMVFRGSLTPRAEVDAILRKKTGRRFSLTLEQAREVRNLLWDNGRYIWQVVGLYGTTRDTVYRIHSGQYYWWCGGGAPMRRIAAKRFYL